MLKPALVLLGLAVVAFWFADLEIVLTDPAKEIWSLLQGAMFPHLSLSLELSTAILNTLTFALVGTVLGALFGGLLSLGFGWWPLRWFSALLRSVHELFWAFLLMPLLGLNPLCGVLAIALPFCGIFAKVFGELFEESKQAPLVELPGKVRRIEHFFYIQLPELWPEIKHYTSYRFECALRSSAVLGFIGLPTLGYHLETWFREGDYGQAFFLLYLFYGLVASLRWWLRPRFVPWIVTAAFLILPWANRFSFARLGSYVAQDLLPWPLRQGLGLPGLWDWGASVWWSQGAEGVWQTLLVAQIALVCAGFLGLLGYPLNSRRFVGSGIKKISFLGLIVLRSTPEYLLAYVLLLVFGPSLLPAVVALSLHNGAILAHLASKRAEQHPPYEAVLPLNRYLYESLPRVWTQFFAYLSYRWEVMIREASIMGFLGIYTLGFYVDSAFAFNRPDEALLLVGFAAALNLLVDQSGRWLRRWVPTAL